MTNLIRGLFLENDLDQGNKIRPDDPGHYSPFSPGEKALPIARAATKFTPIKEIHSGFSVNVPGKAGSPFPLSDPSRFRGRIPGALVGIRDNPREEPEESVP